jgi:hypothetical protein
MREYFLLGTRTIQRTLRNNLSCGDALRLKIGDLVTLGKTASTKRFSLGVLFDHHFPISLRDFLLDNCLVYRTIFF